MLSTQYRLRLEAICERIAKGENVEHHKSRAERFQGVLDGLKSLSY